MRLNPNDLRIVIVGALLWGTLPCVCGSDPFLQQTAAAGAGKVVSRPLQFSSGLELPGEYHHPVFSPDGNSLFVSRRAKFHGEFSPGWERSASEAEGADVDEILKVDLKTGVLQTVIKASDFEGRIGSEALLDIAELEDPRHLRLEFQDAQIGYLRFRLNLVTGQSRAMNATTDNHGHDEFIPTPAQEAVYPAIAACMEWKPKPEMIDGELSGNELFVIPGRIVFLQAELPKYETFKGVRFCDLKTLQRNSYLVRNDSMRITGLAWNGRQGLVSIDRDGHGHWMLLPALRNELVLLADAEPSAVTPLASRASVFIYTTPEHKSALAYFNGQRVIQLTGLPDFKEADLAPTGDRLALISEHDGAWTLTILSITPTKK